MVVSLVTFNGEHELWDIHYNVMKDYVDEFIVVSFDKTFSGKEREAPVIDVAKYPRTKMIVHTEQDYEKYRDMAERSPNTVGASHWKTEFMQKESLRDTLTHLNDNDIVLVGDVDEVVDKSAILLPTPVKIRLEVYTYYLNNHSSEQFWGTTIVPYGILRQLCLNHLRTSAPKSKLIHGWHFTSMGGKEKLEEKLTDSYTQESYATPTVLENIGYNIQNGKDFLGRGFTYRKSEANWPQYLKDNSARYNHLLT